jgi:hypothetical protein
VPIMITIRTGFPLVWFVRIMVSMIEYAGAVANVAFKF